MDGQNFEVGLLGNWHNISAYGQYKLPSLPPCAHSSFALTLQFFVMAFTFHVPAATTRISANINIAVNDSPAMQFQSGG
jgi:hypothetical protein